MVGFIIGAVCAVGLIKVLRHRRRWHARFGQGGYGCGHGYGGYGWDDGPQSRDERWGGRWRWFLRGIFERLGTTPGQEKAIAAALEELRSNREALRAEARQSREDLARVVAAGLVDDAALEETFARHDRLLAQLRVSFVEAVKKAVEGLDEAQRGKVADLLRRGGGFRERAWL
jgi:Spy/CpxP family protein refolding chaperone